MRDRIAEVPNDGIIRYFDVSNLERLVVANLRVLAEVLVHKSYEFIKPPHGLGRILGVCLFLAEALFK